MDRPGARIEIQRELPSRLESLLAILGRRHHQRRRAPDGLARWLVGKTYPQSVYSTGGRYAEEGVFESPDTQVAVFQFDDLVLTFELTLYTPYMIKSDQVLRDSDMYPYWPQNAERIEIYGSKGLMIVGRHGCGWQVFDRPKDRKPVIVQQENGPFPDDEHFDNFVQSRPQPQAAERGHRRGPSQHVHVPAGEHQLPAGRAKAGRRSRRRKRSSTTRKPTRC